MEENTSSSKSDNEMISIDNNNRILNIMDWILSSSNIEHTRKWNLIEYIDYNKLTIGEIIG